MTAADHPRMGRRARLLQSSANSGCPCVNSTSTLASVPGRQCRLPSGEDGIQLTLGGSCVSFTYGSSKCRQHDFIYDPACKVDPEGDVMAPAYCFRPWCYVDLSACKGQSDERVFRSGYFSHESGVDLFYSYSTCNSTADDWFDVEEDIVGNVALKGISLKANVPTYQLPMMYKKDPASGERLSSPGIEFYDDEIPYDGVYLHYANRIVEISGGDINDITHTHRSRASSLVHPTSSFTAAVQDIEDGLVDMSIGPFWITAQRLKMAAFTIPIVYDKTYLVIPRPGTQDDLSDQVRKVLAPFEDELWLLLIGMIMLAAILSVWFSDRGTRNHAGQNTNRRASFQAGHARGGVQRVKRSKMVYVRLALDAFLEKGLFFCSAGVEQDNGASLPNKILMFGFGFLILISVSAYVANLAAFLTRRTSEGVKTMEAAIAERYTICAHPAIKAELQVAWPKATFYFHEEGNEFPGILDDYLAKKCDVMAIGWEDTIMDKTFIDRLCENDLVFTDSMVAEIPIAFPIRTELASGFSYWMYQGERYHDVSIQSSKDMYAMETCDAMFDGEDIEVSDFAQIGIKQMFFPLLFMGVCVVLATVLQLVHCFNRRRGKKSLIGRQSTLNLVSAKDSRESNRAFRRKDSRIRKRFGWNPDSQGKFDCDDKDDEEDPEYAVTDIHTGQSAFTETASATLNGAAAQDSFHGSDYEVTDIRTDGSALAEATSARLNGNDKYERHSSQGSGKSIMSGSLSRRYSNQSEEEKLDEYFENNLISTDELGPPSGDTKCVRFHDDM